MNNFLRTIIAGYGAKKLGGGCFSTILIFFLIYWALGNCNSSQTTNQRHTQYKIPDHHRMIHNYNVRNEKLTAHLWVNR